MTTFRKPTARTAALGGAALAFGLFAATGLAAADTTETSTEVASIAAETVTDRLGNANRDARQIGFGRRGGTK